MDGEWVIGIPCNRKGPALPSATKLVYLNKALFITDVVSDVNLFVCYASRFCLADFEGKHH